MLISETETKNNAHWLLNHVKGIHKREEESNVNDRKWWKRSTYGSELVKLRVAMELILELRYTL